MVKYEEPDQRIRYKSTMTRALFCGGLKCDDGQAGKRSRDLKELTSGFAND